MSKYKLEFGPRPIDVALTAIFDEEVEGAFARKRATICQDATGSLRHLGTTILVGCRFVDGDLPPAEFYLDEVDLLPEDRVVIEQHAATEPVECVYKRQLVA